MSLGFDWTYPGLDRSEFHSLANLLSLRNDGQAELSFLSDVVLDQNWNTTGSEDGYALSSDTHVAQQISSSEHEALKQKFLDCLPEFAANKKGGRTVAFTTMAETEDSVTLWIARNSGFEDADYSVFGRLAKLLGSFADNDANRPEELLWQEMIPYHRTIIEQNYIPDLRASFKACDPVRKGDKIFTQSITSGSVATLFDLRRLLFDNDSNKMRILEKHKHLIIASYDLRMTREIKQLLHDSASATSKSKRLWVNICRLARIRVAIERFKDITLALPNLKKVSINLIPCPLTPQGPSKRSMSLDQTFSILGLRLDSTTSKAILGRGWTLDKARHEFFKQQKQKYNIHAEVQMLMYLTAQSSSRTSYFPYFGCSKLSCFMCNQFLQCYGSITTRGSHDRLFKPWTVPHADGLGADQARRVSKPLVSMQKKIESTLMGKAKSHMQLERTSAFGGSSIMGGQQGEPSQRQLHISRLTMIAERDRVAESFRR
ncbi:hypothetical protein SNOG_14468 [Parastagonospora nodorum SN15]|nr:hypothetical protein SNOG_14468 [Parastagonospora nodorum SN15]EAT78008.1 hypothetical protein SNOG_14468 [Parastagonospora nodorum SN15]